MTYGERVLLRAGPKERAYCSAEAAGAPEECDRALTKVLSGYSYGRGAVAGGLGGEQGPGWVSPSAVGTLHVSVASAALPGGDIALASLDAAWSSRDVRRVRVTVLDAQGLFVCRDTLGRTLAPPLVGMLTRACAGDGVFALDAGLLAIQWDLASHRVIGEWARLGPAFELLGNGLSYAHALRSIELGLPFDLRSAHAGADRAENDLTLGAGLRASAFVRSPHWEARAWARHRAALVGGAGARRDNSVEGEVLMLHNFFVSDALVMQAGVSLRASWSQVRDHGFSSWASSERHTSLFAGLYLGWVHEAPAI